MNTNPAYSRSELGKFLDAIENMYMADFYNKQFLAQAARLRRKLIMDPWVIALDCPNHNTYKSLFRYGATTPAIREAGKAAMEIVMARIERTERNERLKHHVFFDNSWNLHNKYTSR